MCGNFGLLLLGLKAGTVDPSNHQNNNESFHKTNKPSTDGLDQSINASMHEVSRLQGIRFRDSSNAELEPEHFLPPLKILEAQTACTEIRGGQAGGFSSIEYKYEQSKTQSHFDTLFGPPVVAVPTATRVRMVARKRHPLAADLAQLYLRHRRGKQLNPKDTVTVIGHTRFATSSVNVVPELHPHEWVPFHDEVVWLFNVNSGKFERVVTVVGIHISHNGDFDAMEAYSQTMVNEEIGLWLERILHTPNDTRGDSPKIAGSMDLLRVQGRWAAAARLAWIRTVYTANTDVSNGEQLSKSAPNVVPAWSFWSLWATEIFEELWQGHINNIIQVAAPNKFELKKRHTYTIQGAAVKAFVQAVLTEIHSQCMSVPEKAKQLGIEHWSASKLHAFVHTTVRGFLRADLYNAMTELLSRAEGSFGLQAHCTLEPGVVVIASKGQPMSIAFDPHHPIVLFASEAEALAVPVYESGKWLPQRIDLDSHGEIFRLGEPRSLQEGTYFAKPVASSSDAIVAAAKAKASSSKLSKQKQQEVLAAELLAKKNNTPALMLDCGVEIRCYSLPKCTESTMQSLIDRSVFITSAPIPYDPKVDLVLNDLKVTPAVLAAIDHAWSNSRSVERISGQSFAENLLRSMQRRMVSQKDTTDLIIGGVEVSLWLAEQFAADLRRIFPNLNVSTVSANKLIGVGDENPAKVFFPSSEDILTRRIDSNTCVLLVSQSGQTFPTLHATRKMVSLAKGKVWILTGCFHSKMQQVLMEQAAADNAAAKENLYDYRDRVFNNYSGHRPAEPSSVAVAATWHTLSRMLLHIVEVSRQLYPGGRFIHPWDYDSFAYTVQCFVIQAVYKLRRKKVRGLTTQPLETTSSSLVSRLPFKGISSGNDPMNESEFQMTTIYPEQVSFYNGVNNQKTKALPSKTGGMKLLGNNPQVVMNLSDGCITDFRSLLTSNLIMNISQIVGYDQFGRSLLTDPVYEEQDGSSRSISTTHVELVEQGKTWAAHINEPWHVLVLVSCYIMLSVGLGITIFGLLGDAVLAIVQAGLGADYADTIGRGHLLFPPRVPSVIYSQPIGYTLLGVLLQFLDGWFFVFLGKNMTRLFRLFQGRPVAARHGKRTIVIVDTPCVHQLVEIFVSKLFSQSYSIISVDVHGASGLDHFVHRFTHRVVRGVLLAVGRPDGRLCCLAKSEASVLLSTKQAAFICNPDYVYPGTGPEIVTIGHNPYQPNVGLTSNHICLHGGLHVAAVGTAAGPTTRQIAQAARRNSSVDQWGMLSSHGSVHGTGNGGAVGGASAGVGGIAYSTHARDISFRAMNRKKFVDEYLYDRLFVAKKPFTTTILRTLRRSFDTGANMIHSQAPGASSSRHHTELHSSTHGLNQSTHSLTTSYHLKRSTHSRGTSKADPNLPDEPLPYGVQHIDPQILQAARSLEDTVFADFVLANKDLLKPHILNNKGLLEGLKEKSFDPAVRLAFSSKLDSQARQVQDLQVIIQQLYECRVASLERYLAFCVMFHTMAKSCSSPWLLYPWDMARSQSNLRVATTASPISAAGSASAEHTISPEARKLAHQFITSVRKFEVHF